MKRTPIALFLAVAAACSPSSPSGEDGGDSQPNVDSGLPGEDASSALTWYGDVEPVVQRGCLGCHVEGGIAPFTLERYDVAKAYAGDIHYAVSTRAMPPWPPSDECTPLRDTRRLSEADIATITTWVEQGALEGDPNDHVEPTVRQGLPRVDLELEMAEGYVPNADRSDDYRCFILDPQLSEDRFITGIDIQPGQRGLVHHVLLFPAKAANAAALDASEPGPGWTCYGGPGTDSQLALGAWAPGTPPSEYPAGTGVRLAAGDVIVMQVHYHLQHNVAAPDKTKVQLRLEPSVERVATMFPLYYADFAIPPQTSGHTAGFSLDISLLSVVAPNTRLHGVLPHMHTLGRSIRFVAMGGPFERCLVDIPSWDFHWQQAYFFEEPGGVALGGSNALRLECTWDNPTDRTVRWGDGTNDEMCLVYLYVTGIPDEILNEL